MLENILAIVALGSPQDSITRLAEMIKDVYQCVRLHGETFSPFTDICMRKRRLVMKHFALPKSYSDSQAFEMVGLDNANLRLSLYNAIITVLFSDAVQNRPAETSCLVPNHLGIDDQWIYLTYVIS